MLWQYFFQVGFTPIHIAAKYGHASLIEKFAKSNVNLRQVSRKMGLSALHVAAYYGEEGKLVLLEVLGYICL